MSTVAVLGCGLLGSGMVENLLTKGNTVRVWNRTAARAEALASKGAIPCLTPSEAAKGADRVHLVLSDDAAVDHVINLVRPGLGAQTPLLDHTTNLPSAVAARHARLRADGIAYTHCPVFMSPANARSAQGIMMVGGPPEELAGLVALLAPMTGRVWEVGAAPERSAVYKLMGNAVLISMVGSLGDMLAIGDAGGLDSTESLALFEVFNLGGLFPASTMRVARKGEMPASFELTMARKDVRLMLQHAQGPDGLVVLPAVAAAMDAAIADGHGNKDYTIYAWPRGRKPSS